MLSREAPWGGSSDLTKRMPHQKCSYFIRGVAKVRIITRHAAWESHKILTPMEHRNDNYDFCSTSAARMSLVMRHSRRDAPVPPPPWCFTAQHFVVASIEIHCFPLVFLAFHRSSDRGGYANAPSAKCKP